MLRIAPRSVPRTLGTRSLYTPHLDSDLNITKKGKVNVTVGTGGRSSRTGYTATVFGASGFLGRYITSKLGRHGTTTVIPWRDQMKSRFLKVTGDLGVIHYSEFDLRNIKSIEDAVSESDIVINLIGADYNTKNFSMADVNIEAARRIAQATKDAGVSRYIHVSSYNANVNSKSEFYATKGAGEEVVREIIPDATIVRPAPVYGREDNFLTALAAPVVPFETNGFERTIYPTHVLDVAKALERIAFDDETAGLTYELFGTQKYTVKEIRDLVAAVVRKPNLDYLHFPKEIASVVADIQTKALWWDNVNPDQIERQHIDQFIDKSLPTYADLGIEPDRVSDFIFAYTKKFRPALYQHDLPPTEKLKRRLGQFVQIIP